MQLWHSALENGSSFSVSPTSSRFSSGRFSCQSSNKIWVVGNSAFAGASRRTTNFETTLDFGRTVRHFLFPFTWRTRLTTMTTRFTRRSSNGHIVNLPLLHDSRNANTTLRCWLTRRWPYSAQTIPLLAGILHHPTTLKHLLKAGLQIRDNSGRRFTCNCGPGNINRATGDAVRNSSRLGKHLDASLREETALRENRLPYEVLDAQQHTTHDVFRYGNPIQTHSESLSSRKWPTQGKSCQLEDLKQHTHEPRMQPS